MRNYWAIAIGISQYENLQPLPNAQSDAVALRNFWVDKAKAASDQCVLLADVPSTSDVKAIYPNRKNIQTWIAQFCKQVQSDDFLACFFNGYGIEVEGKDYLLPIDSHPTQISSTGISVEALFATLQSAATSNILLVVEIYQSQHYQPLDRVGAQTAALADGYGISTILSYSPAPSSSGALPDGDQRLTITTALLEGIAYQNCATLDQLVQYLSQTMPQLSINNWQSGQNLVAIVPDTQRQQRILPKTSVTLPKSAQPAPSTEILPAESETSLMNTWIDRFWQSLSLATILVVIGFVIMNRYGSGIPSASVKKSDSVYLHSNQSLSSEKGKEGGTDKTSDKTGDAAKSPDEGKKESASDKLAQSTNAVKANLGVGLKTDPTQKDEQSNASPSQLSATTISALESARNGLQARQYEQGLKTLDQIPEKERGEEYNQLRQQINQGLLNEARALINQVSPSSQMNQASNFSYAIAKARAIRPGDPLYEQAQKDIERWSQVIWDLAQGRANQKNYEQAVSAARLIPAERKNLYPDVQKAIAQWQKAKANKATLEQAKLSIQRFQPVSYSQALAKIRKIQADEPFYEDARALRKEWSDALINLSQAHAAQGEFSEAIQVATMIPKDTPGYQNAQSAIAQWRNENNKK